MTKEEIIDECKQRLGFETDYEMYSLCQHEKDFLKAIIKALDQPTSDDVMAIHTQGLDEAIKHCQEVAEENQAIVDACDYYGDNMAECETCADEHRQLAEWLKDYKRLLEQPTSDDCVSRQAVIEYIEACGAELGHDIENESVREDIMDMPSVTPVQRWIPCSERLPEEIGTYLVTLEYKEHGKGVTTLWYHGGQFGWDLCIADVVIAWQPLPKPYEEKRGNENDSN